MIENRKLIANSSSVLINRLTQSISTFLVLIFIARILGPYSLGQYTLAFNYYFLFMTLASQGFKTLFTRELSCEPEQTPLYLVSGSLLQLFTSVLSYFILLVIVSVLPYTSQTSFFCYVLGLMIIPFSLSNITEAIFQAYERMHLIAISTVPIYILRTFAIIWALNHDFGLLFVCLCILISEIIVLFIQWGFLVRKIEFQWGINWKFMYEIVKKSFAFIAIEGIAVFKGRMLVIILSLFSSEAVVGLYGSIVQLLQPFEIIAHSLVIAVFPSMSKAVKVSKEKQQQLAEIVVESLLCVALPIIIGVSFVGGKFLVLVYGNPTFLEAAIPLNIMALALFVASFTRPLGYLLVANGLEKINLFEVANTSVIGGSLGLLILIPKYHLIGAALDVVIMQILTSGIYVFSVYKNLFPLRLRSILFRPSLIGLLMLLVFALLQKTSSNIILIIAISSLSYLVCTSMVYVTAFGGPFAVWKRLAKTKI